MSSFFSKLYIVELEPGVWLAHSSCGDPSRTLVKGRARGFITRVLAEKGLENARKFRPFLNAKIECVETR